ncbi:hypothetical protein MHBO_004259 [Bonamia ostreae]|uniref:RRM domain-containing protein n=1 Tax=Bonamia ostreae TaxID=126728 RepID=A0ABV2ATH8_9EUKA
MKQIAQAGDDAQGTTLSKLDLESAKVFESMDKRDKDMGTLLDKYKKLYQKKRQMLVIQKSIAKQFSLSMRTAQHINESLLEDPTRDKNSVHVTNLPGTVTVESLRTHFEGCGKVVRATIPLNRAGRSKGYAFVEFEAEEAVEEALKMSGGEIEERVVLIHRKRKNIPGMGSKSWRSHRRAGRRGRPRGRRRFSRGRNRFRGRTGRNSLLRGRF